ncbi:MAG: hypothetical protein JWO80_2784 [Bryobacterales bacterium]|nr:hypothetical protein [Bryobacterales bacterium]
MADFRKYALAFAGLACTLGLTGTAYGQSSTTCVASVANPFDQRAEGVTEQAGDITLACTGGTPTAAGATIPLVNISITGNAAITSRLLNTSTQQSESLLLVDEPNTAISGFGLSICPVPTSTTSVNGCTMLGTGLGGGATSPTYNPGGGLPAGTARYNGFQGTQVANNIVTFFGVPFDPPAAGSTLFLRITNVRLNVSALGAPTAGSFSTVQSLLSISASAGFSINNPVQVVGNVRRGLVVNSVTVANSTSTTLTPLQQCSSTSTSSFPLVEQINFSEGFASAFKLRVPTALSGGVGSLSIPGNFQNSESQFIPPQNPAIGLADFGTRIKITFNNLQTGVTVYVPTTVNSAQLFSGIPSSSLTLTSTEAGGFSPVGAGTATGTPANFAPLTVTSGSAVAVYEVSSQLTVGTTGPAVNQSTSTVESFGIPVAISYSASPSTNSPGLGTSTVNVDFAPTTGSLPTAAGFGVAGGTIPRFVPTSTAANGFSINACSTVLLFPFMSNLAGFDTGIAISSTSTDPFGTAAQSGSCTLNFYGTAAPAAFTTPVVASGTSYTNLLSTAAPGFQGYMIAQCRFQYAHGFAFITDGFGGPGRGLSQGYLALVLQDPNATGGRKANPPGAQVTAGAGEQSGQ